MVKPKKSIPFRRKIGHVFELLHFLLWLLAQRLRYKKKLVVIYRSGGLGDVLCTLAMCGEIRRRHPETRIVFLTENYYKKMVMLSGATDEVYGAKGRYPFMLPAGCKVPGVVEGVYKPRTTEEPYRGKGTKAHLIDEYAKSCGFIIPTSSRQPRLYPPAELIKTTQVRYGVAQEITAGGLIIGINAGHSWPVREWGAEKWQALVDNIHAEFDAVVLQFGLTTGPNDELEHLQGARLLSNRLESDELVSLIASCDLLISIDSGPLHVAGAVGVPVIGLFGAIAPEFRMPPDSPGVGLSADVPCIFCHHKTPRTHWISGCPNDVRCMKELHTQTVFEAVKEMLAKRQTGRANQIQD